MSPVKSSIGIARRARAVVKGPRRACQAGRSQGALGSLIIAMIAASAGLAVGSVVGTETGSGAGLATRPDAPMAAASTQLARKLAGDLGTAYEIYLPYEEPLVPEDLEAEGEEYDYTITGDALVIAVPPDEEPAAENPADGALWQQYAVAVPGLNGQPVIALVVDDLGMNRANSRRAIDLPAPLTMSFLSYAEGLEELTAKARDAGHELLVHVPMEPRDLRWDPGPNALLVGLPEDELDRRLEWALGRFDGYVGINNHMGSRFTTSLLGMAQVMAALKSRGLLFLDSLTAGSSVGLGLAQRLGVPHVGRDIFIDNTPDDERSIWTQLRKLERVARRRGNAIGIAHPHDLTLEVLARWIPQTQRRGFALVPLTTVVERTMAAAGHRAN